MNDVSHTEVEARLLDRAMLAGCQVLEAGCGRRTRLAERRDRIARLVGIDVDPVACAENTALDEFIVADLCGPLPLPTGSFDLVYANFVVEHLARPSVAFRELRRVLRPGGSLILLTSNRANPLLAAARLFPEAMRQSLKRAGAGVAARDVIPLHQRANTPWRLHALLRDAGFRRVELRYVATLHRYAARSPALGALVRRLEIALPPPLRSTLVAWYEAV